MIIIIIRNEITNEQALDAIKNNEFNPDIINSNEFVVIIMTQDWCPQWLKMSKWIFTATEDLRINIYTLIYNKADCFQDFMNFKENKWNNDQIPYLRFYKAGNLSKETNYVSEENFKDIISAP